MRAAPPLLASSIAAIGAMNVTAVTIRTMRPTTPARGPLAGPAIGTSPLHVRTMINSRNRTPSATSATYPFMVPIVWVSILGPRPAAKRENAWTVAPSSSSTENTLTDVGGRSVTAATMTSPLRPIAVPSSRPLNLPLRNNGMLQEPPPAKPCHRQNLFMRTLSAC